MKTKMKKTFLVWQNFSISHVRAEKYLLAFLSREKVIESTQKFFDNPSLIKHEFPQLFPHLSQETSSWCLIFFLTTMMKHFFSHFQVFQFVIS